MASVDVNTASSASADLSPAEREQGLRYVEQTRADLVRAVEGLSEAQWKFKPAPDRWSVWEIVEHLAIVEDRLRERLSKIHEAPAPPPGRNPSEIEALIIAQVPQRTERYPTPEAARPTGHWSPAIALENYNSACAGAVEVLQSSSDLRAHAMEHPVFGPLDGYQWILIAAAHTARHTNQIAEVKSHPEFPQPNRGPGLD